MSLDAQRVAARSGKMCCQICEKPRLLICHHIHGRASGNQQWNLCWLCASCHDEIHSGGRIIIEGWILTSEGKKLIWRRAGEEALANEGAKPPLYSKKPQYESDFGFPSVMYRWKGDTRMSYEVRSVKDFEGMEGLGFNAILYRDGIKVASVIDEGNGGEMLFRWEDYKAPRVEVPWSDYQGRPNSILCTPEEAKLYEFIRGKMFDSEVSGQIQMSIGIFLSGMVDDYENAKRFKRICKTKTLFRVKGDKSGEWRTIKGIFSKRIKDFIIGKYGDQVESIMNESLGQVAA